MLNSEQQIAYSKSYQFVDTFNILDVVVGVAVGVVVGVEVGLELGLAINIGVTVH